MFEHDGLTKLLFYLDGVNLEMGKLALWRLSAANHFGATWLSDYIPNYFGVKMGQSNDRSELLTVR